MHCIRAVTQQPSSKSVWVSVVLGGLRPPAGAKPAHRLSLRGDGAPYSGLVVRVAVSEEMGKKRIATKQLGLFSERAPGKVPRRRRNLSPSLGERRSPFAPTLAALD